MTSSSLGITSKRYETLSRLTSNKLPRDCRSKSPIQCYLERTEWHLRHQMLMYDAQTTKREISYPYFDQMTKILSTVVSSSALETHNYNKAF